MTVRANAFKNSGLIEIEIEIEILSKLGEISEKA
jgi:hypothetical protein